MSTATQLTLPVSTNALDPFLREIHNIPVLSAEEEHALAVRFAEEGDLEAARELVMSNLRFVVHIARGYSGYGLPLGDLVQEGNVGLMKAVKRFDPHMGVRLVSFAVHWIRAEIHEYVLRNWRIVKVATTKAQRKLFFNLRKAKQRLGWLNRAEVETVASDLGVTPENVLEMEKRLAAHDPAFDGPMETDEDQAFAPAAYLEDHRFEPAAQVEAEQTKSHSEKQLAVALQDLDERSSMIIQRRWLNDDKKATLHELAAEYGVSAERIRQIEGNALKKLRGAIAI